MTTSAIYTGSVMHERYEKKPHKFKYPLTYFCLALKELPALDNVSPLFSWNKATWFSFHDKDHGLGDGTSLENFLKICLNKADYDVSGFEFVVMSLPRVLGYAFNPITFIYCYKNALLEAMIYEVNNTFNERIFYILPVKNQPIRQMCEKKMTVSPFFDLSGRYDFRISDLGAKVSNVVDYSEGTNLKMRAIYVAERLPFNQRQINKILVTYPLQSYKVIFSIHFEALFLWLKGLRVRKRQKIGSVGIVINEQMEVIK